MSTSVINWSSRPVWANPMDAHTWTYRRDEVPGVGEVSSVWNPVPFSTWKGGTPHHFESLVFLVNGEHGDSRSYVTEEEMKDGHARMVSALRAIAESLS